jgi:aminopeptidase N
LFNRGVHRTVLDDLTGAFRAFTDWSGPPLTQKLVIVDQPLVGVEGQSSHGLIHLTQTMFRTKRGWERYRAHEVAHQWWGHTATPRSLRDEWLSEGLAEISAAMYLLDVSHDTTSYDEMIDFWRRQVLEEGKTNGQYSRGYRAGPIVLGSRLLLSRSPGDYFSLVYCKAGYMLEMLRFEMDGPDYRTDFFKQMLADYRQTYFNKQASSADFIGVVRKFLGPVRTTTFFNQWLYDWRVPDINATYAVTPHERGGYMVEIEIDVSDVGPDFETPYPIEIKFADGTEKTYRIDGVGQVRSHLLGPFPQEIDDVRFDPHHVVLVEKTKVDER